ncbi:hypothetical protein B0H13DRAFT_1865795 [Mycena leptocephala]|nr:hypothetical protein B0H13DRAFT_1865795 [Mycena leptocephala]
MLKSQNPSTTATLASDFGSRGADVTSHPSRAPQGRIDPPQLPLELIELIRVIDDSRNCTIAHKIFHPVVWSAANGSVLLGAKPLSFLTPRRFSDSSALYNLPQPPCSLQSVGWTFGSLRRVRKSSAHLKMLPDFIRLRSLVIWCGFPAGLALLPQLTELELFGKFGSYLGFVSFMSDLPALQNLTPDGVVWDDSPDPHFAFPTLELKTVSLDWGHQHPVEHIMLSLHARRLILSFWLDPSPDWLLSIPKYLHHLGDHLRYLQLDCESHEQINCVSGLDCRHITSLQHLRIGTAVRYNVLATSSEVAVAPQLERLLARITPHCRLETLILGVETECIINPPRWTPFPQFAELMDAPQFAAVSEIQFVVNGSPFCLGGSARRAREHFESLPPATLPSRPARRVVFIDGEDLDKVYC